MNAGVLARRYAQAYCAVFSNVCSLDMIEKLSHIHAFFMSHKKALFMLGLPQIALVVKREALLSITERVGLSSDIVNLFVLLIVQKRAGLIPQVCVQLRELVLDNNNMIECTISSAQELIQEEKRAFDAFFTQHTKHAIKARYVVDETLIAGIAMQSTTYAWEYSIRKQLHTVNQMLIR